MAAQRCCFFHARLLYSRNVFDSPMINFTVGDNVATMKMNVAKSLILLPNIYNQFIYLFFLRNFKKYNRENLS
jgi:hypothetical protein